MIITENCLINGMPETLYHSDPTPVLDGFAHSSSISSSNLITLIEKSEAEAFTDNARLNPPRPEADEEKKDTQTIDKGTIAHDFILRGARGTYEILPYKDFRTKEAQEARDSCIARGLIALNTTTEARVLGAVRDMESALRKQLSTHQEWPGLMTKGKAEQSAFVLDGNVWLRARFDWLEETYPDVVVDYKTTGLSFDSWEKNQLWGSDGAKYIQKCHYKRVYQLLMGRPCKFIFVVQQTFAPYLVKLFVIDESIMEETVNRYDQGRMRYINCLKTGIWRGHPPYTHHSYPPAWVAQRWEADALNEEWLARKAQEEAQAAKSVIMAG